MSNCVSLAVPAAHKKMTKREKAEALFCAGCNCSQSVFLAFEEEAGLSRETMLKLSAALGGGVGGLREVCGAVTGMALVLGILTAPDDPTNREQKGALYARMQALAHRFEAENATLICRELLEKNNIRVQCEPSERTPAYYQTRPCARYVGMAAELLEEALFEKTE